MSVTVCVALNDPSNRTFAKDGETRAKLVGRIDALDFAGGRDERDERADRGPAQEREHRSPPQRQPRPGAERKTTDDFDDSSEIQF